MALKLCSNCRLPVHESVAECPMCAARNTSTVPTPLRAPVVATIALVATVAVLARRFA